MESINYLLILILFILLIVLVLRFINRSNNNSLLYVNNIDRFINKLSNSQILKNILVNIIKMQNALERLKNQAESNKPKKQQKPYIKSLPYKNK